ncbi:MAG: YheT family hydrolase [Candidatus Promineifilaceae bacterium]
MQPAFDIEAFTPSPLWLSAHAQTILANSLRSTDGVRFHRLRLDTQDGDFIDLDFASVAGIHLAPSAPLVLLLHGLEGSARRSYACETYRQLARRGVRAVGMNFRSCSGEMNRTQGLYHAGKTDDVALVVKWLHGRWPHVRLGAAGFSLGANMLLKYLGENGANTPLDGAAVVSPPFDLERASEVFENGTGRRYGARFLSSLQAKALVHARRNGGGLNVDRILNVQSMREFDNAFTAPVHGFRDAADYYNQVSSKYYLDGIRVNTLVIRAMDDPMFANDIPHALLAANPAIFPALTPYGGHVAFAEGSRPRHFRYWAERQAARFLAGTLNNDYQPSGLA